MTGASADPPTNEAEHVLSIPVDIVRFIIGKLRECGGKDMLAKPAQDSCPPDSASIDAQRGQEHAYAAAVQELYSLIDGLPKDQQVDLVALAWLGRDSCVATDWPAIRGETAEAYFAQTARYLLGMSMVGDFLEEGLSALGSPGERASPAAPPYPTGNAPGKASPSTAKGSSTDRRTPDTRLIWRQPSTQT